MPKIKPKKFTVLLLYPDSIAGCFGQDTLLVWKTGKNANQAIEKAQRFAVRENNKNTRPDDWHALACFRGHLKDEALYSA